MSPLRTLANLVAAYGDGREPALLGVLSEHLPLVERDRLGWVHRTASREWAVDAATGKAFPVLCSELIAVYTEDGMGDGRCGLRATDLGCCDNHAAVVRQWAAEREAERAS